MGNNIKTLQKENDTLKQHLKQTEKDMETLKMKISEESKASHLTDQARGLQFLSDEYDALSASDATISH